MARRRAFLIGNEHFAPASGMEPLHGPLNDIAALETVLADPLRGECEVTRFADAGRSDIMPALEEALNEAETGDLMLLFYAGHGKLDPAGRLCLATADTRSAALYSTSIPAAELRNLISNSRCEQVVLLLDCCYSGAVGKEFARGGVDDQLALMREAQGLHVLTASTGFQTAKELMSDSDGRVMGKFTRAIVEGIGSGAADVDRDGNVTLSDLRRHLAETIRGQTPQYWAQDAAGDPRIARAGPAQTPAEKRLYRLGAWYAQGAIPLSEYPAISAAANGEGDPRLVALVSRLLDDRAIAPAALVGAWMGAIRPPPTGSYQRPSASLPPDPPPPPAPTRPSAMAQPLAAEATFMTGLRFKRADWIAFAVIVGVLAAIEESSGNPDPTALGIVVVLVAMCFVAVKAVRRAYERVRRIVH